MAEKGNLDKKFKTQNQLAKLYLFVRPIRVATDALCNIIFRADHRLSIDGQVQVLAA